MLPLKNLHKYTKGYNLNTDDDKAYFLMQKQITWWGSHWNIQFTDLLKWHAWLNFTWVS